MSPLNENLGRRVDWFGRKGTIEGVWTGPTYAIKFDDGEDVTVGADKVTLLDPKPASASNQLDRSTE